MTTQPRTAPRRKIATPTLTDHIDALREATAGHPLRIRVTVEIGDGNPVDQAILDRVNAMLAEIKAGWMAE